MKIRILFFAAIFFFFSLSFLISQNADDRNENRIIAISISGLKRTRLSTAERPLKKFIGREADKMDPDEVKAVIIDTGILEPLSVDIVGQVLVVEVLEKWPIFPVPVAMAGSDGISAGLAFFDANAFGLNDKFFVAGLYLSEGWVASTGYVHTSPGGRVPGWNGAVIFSREERRDRNQRNEVLRSFKRDAVSVIAGFDLPLMPNNDLISTSAQFSFHGRFPEEPENTLNGPDKSLLLYGLGGDITARRSSWDGYFLSQEAATLWYSFKTNFEGFYCQSVRLRFIWEKSLVPGFRFCLRTGIVFDPDAPILFESSPSSAQVAILPRGFSAKNYAGASAGLEKHLIKFSAGTVSLAAAYQLVYSQGSLLGDTMDHGIMGSLGFYLSKIAIPALGLGAAYNVKENYLQGSFSLGMSF